MLRQTGPELRVCRLFHHRRHRLHNLLFRIVNVAQHMDEKIVHGAYIFREKAHALLLYLSRKSPCFTPSGWMNFRAAGERFCSPAGASAFAMRSLASAAAGV